MTETIRATVPLRSVSPTSTTRVPLRAHGAIVSCLVVLTTLACHPAPSAERGRALLVATRDSLPAHVGGNLRCTSCHLDAGRRVNAAPLIGVLLRYPQFRSRTARTVAIEERVNDCFQRSLNGTALASDSPDMRDIIAYLAVLSRGIKRPGAIPGQGLHVMPSLHGDSARGATVYTAVCARCHGANGDGTVVAPALWGGHSYNIGASMATPSRAAAFIRYNMPYDQPGTLSDQQAFDVARFIDTHSRPDFAGKELDWPHGGAPSDLPYVTRGATNGSRRR